LKVNAGDIVTIAQGAEALKRLTRTGWAIAGVDVHRQESVAEHSYGTALLTLLISKSLQSSGIDVRLAQALTMATLHDLAESRISDIPHTAVIAGGEMMREAKTAAERQAFSESIINDPLLMKLWDELERAETLEARVVRGADVVDMLVHALSLEKSGVSPELFSGFFDSSVKAVEKIDIQIVSEIFALLKSQHERNLQRV